MTEITIKARNVCGIERADLQGSGILLVGGLNGVGKTSLLMATAAALTGITIPYEEITRGHGGVMVRSGSDGGGVQVSLPDGRATIHWPKAELKTEGKPPRSSAVAAGLIDFLTMKDRDRAVAIARFIHAEPAATDLVAALRDAGIEIPERAPDESEEAFKKRNLIGQIWAAIEAEGWDGAHKKARDSGVALKDRWKQATGGQTWGSDKGGKWLPPGWSDDLREAKLEDLETAVTAAQKQVESAVANAAVDQAELERLQGLAAKAPELREQLAAAKEKVAATRQTVANAQAALEALPKPEQDDPMTCPHCGEPIKVTKRLDGFEIAKGTKKKITETELKKRRTAIIDAEGAVRQAERALSEATTEVARLMTEVDQANAAADKVKAAAGRSGSADAVAEARAALSTAQSDLTAFKLKSDADTIHAKLLRNQEIVQILAPEGLRKATLVKAVEKFNTESLAPLCDAAGWKRVELDDNLVLTYGGRAYPLSASEKYRMRATLQVAVAQLDGSDIVIFDGADILDAPGRNGLFKMLRHWGGAALVGMTFSKPDLVPDLSAIKPAPLGASYWIENATAVTLAEALTRKAAA